jgi:hypothetical protein
VELDDVIDEMIAERVIHRHRWKWITFFVALVVAVALVWVLGGWKEPDTRVIDTVEAPYTVESGRFKFDIESARIVQTPKRKFTEAKAELIVKLGVTNTDDETKTSASVGNGLLYLVPRKGKPIESNGASCRGELNYNLVYGLPAESCESKFEVPPGYSDTEVEIGVFTEVYEADEGIAVSDKPWWQRGEAQVVVRMTAEVVVDK